MQVVYKNAKKETKSFFGSVLLLGLITFVIIALGAWNSPKEEPTYSVKLPLNAWQGMVECLRKSQAPAVTTNALIEEISKQIDPILQSEAKIQDSLNKLKTKPKQ